MAEFDPSWNDPNGFPSSPYPPTSPLHIPPDEGKIQRRLMLPAIFLIILAAFDLLFTVLQMVGINAGGVSSQPTIGWPSDMDPQAQQMAEQWLSMAQDPATLMASGILSLVLSGFVLFGGVSMLTRRRWPLALTGAIIALIPCFGPCCGLTLPFGIWSLVVLSNSEIKQAFR